MTRKAIALDAYLSGHSSREAARLAGLAADGSYVRELARLAGLSRPVGRPRKFLKGDAGLA
jgi:hypothetical protein